MFPFLFLALLGVLSYIVYNYQPASPEEDTSQPEQAGFLRELIGQESITTEVNAKAPGLASVSLDNRNIRSIDFIGDKVILLEFWSVFCTSCIQEMPFLGELYEKYREDGLEVIGINTDYFGNERIRRFFNRLEPRPVYPVIHDQSQEISRAFNVEAIPVTILIDSSGWIRMYHLGYKPEDQKTIEKMVKKWVGRIKETEETVRPVDGKTPVAMSGTGDGIEGKPLPHVSVMDMEGRRLSLAEYQGKRPMVIFFWSLFCQPCRQEMPHLSKLARMRDRIGDLVFLSVNLDTSRLTDQVDNFLDRVPLDFPTLLDAHSDPPGSLADKLEVNYTPTIILVGRDGIVSNALVGGLSKEEIDRQLDSFVSAQGVNLGRSY